MEGSVQQRRHRKDGDLQLTQRESPDERAGSEDRKHTSGGVVIAVDSNLIAVVGVEEGAIDSISGNEGRIAQAWVNVRGGLRNYPSLLMDPAHPQMRYTYDFLFVLAGMKRLSDRLCPCTPSHGPPRGTLHDL